MTDKSKVNLWLTTKNVKRLKRKKVTLGISISQIVDKLISDYLDSKNS